ncbi:ATP-dependent nuclease [Lacrimispora sphenoides]|uniref:Predicted ATP-dependent endonuclease of the OLD family, contains P-loop ATPase and TOPRIM domains n=1 Tax=Lacrimispora sphenoides JCM 1415 TaxID=1297793 RepID=A0ABY1C6A2_9FIRM|nr:AAA family ATPase [Lacrimispora sphenoides]SET73731.1 Predicted ATP-dependent endonuclease of the OLD family, contains P-loop ATPase and TOPRIM domains [[Clostridium] sphenoides JCM 1415]SUY50877.1 conjugative transposon DNA recombination protein [Lacrimispora sphenoides]
MKISRLIIKNYRNLKEIDIHLSDTVALIGENNCGKSNLLRAVTLPFLTDESSFTGKNLNWIDINDIARREYYQYIIDNQTAITNGIVSCTEFITHLPIVMVEVHLKPDKTEGYFVKDLSFSVEDGQMQYGLRYEYKPSKINDIYSIVKKVLSDGKIDAKSINNVKMNLLPTEYYSFSVSVPSKGSVTYDVLKLYKYIALEAERDEFSRTKERLGSRSLVKLLQKGLTNEDKLKVEKEYNHFFEELKSISNMDRVINWQEGSELADAKEFFSHISILPNMPPMQSILSSIRLGYSDEELSLQGLGYRNLILLFVLINSLVGRQNDVALNVFAIEEPEAHLCINNIRLMVSFLKVFTAKNPTMQLFYSTHSTEFINKMNLKNVVVMHNGEAFSFMDELDDSGRDYLTKNPNLDLFKLFFSKKCILFEGISEEMLLRAYIDSKQELSDIEVLSFHKGFIEIIKIWKKINKNNSNKLGIIRDYDNQEKAKKQHDKYDDGTSICIRTTSEYTLEPEIVKTGNNFTVLKDKYGEGFGWKDMTPDQMEKAWREAKASDMLTICKDIANGELSDLQMPKHIQDVFDFLK